MNLYDWVSRHARAFLFVLALVVLGGIAAALTLPVTLFPQVTYPRIRINADAGDLSAHQTMLEITRPLEEAIHTVPGVRNVRSVTSRGSCEVSAFFPWGTDMEQAFLQSEAVVAQARGGLGPDVQVEVLRMDPTVFPILAYSLTSSKIGLQQTRDLAEFTLRPLMLKVPGVQKVEIQGGEVPEYQIRLDPAKMAGRGVTAQDVAGALAQNNLEEVFGRLEHGYTLALGLTQSRPATAQQIGALWVRPPGQAPVRIADVATVEAGHVPQYLSIRAAGLDAVLLNVYQERTANAIAVRDALADVVRQTAKRLPSGTELEPFYDQAELVSASFSSVTDTIAIGVLLSVGVLFLFFRRVRVTLVTAVIVPVTLVATVLLLKLFGLTFNVMTLGGMAAAIGLVLDDAIVVVENIERRVRHDKLGEVGIGAGLADLLRPIVGSSFSSIAVFIPLGFLTGVAGAFFRSLSFTMAAALGCSLLLSLTLLPLLVKYSGLAEPGRAIEKTEPGERWQGFYQKSLGYLLDRPWMVVAALVLSVSASFLIYKTMPSDFLPAMDEGAFILDFVTEPGTSLKETGTTLAKIEAILKEAPEVANYSIRAGAQLGGGLTEPNQGDFLVKMKSGSRRDIEDVMDEVRTKIAQSVPGVRVEFFQLMEDVIGDLTSVPQPIEVKLFGSRQADLEPQARRVAEVLRGIPGVVDVFDGITVAGPAWVVLPDPARAGLYGLSAEQVQDALRYAAEGVVVSKIPEAEREIGMRVVYPADYKRDPALLRGLLLTLPRGRTVHLEDVATVKEEPGQTEIDREDLQPVVAVTARLAGRDMGSALTEIQRTLPKKIALPPGIRLEYGGMYRQQQESFRGLLIVVGAALLLVFAILLFEFGSFRPPLVIVLVQVMSALGVFALLRLTGTALNISSMLGLVMIVGIVAENAIFVFHYVYLYEKQGLDPRESLIRAGLTRSRPIVMTTLVAVLALLPLAVGWGFGAQMQKPLAIAIIGGFSLSSLLLLYALPVFFATLSRRKAEG